MKIMNRQEMLDIYHQGPEALLAVLTVLFNKTKKLQCRVDQLEIQGKKTPKNSHKPLSINKFHKPKPKILRQKNRKQASSILLKIYIIGSTDIQKKGWNV